MNKKRPKSRRHKFIQINVISFFIILLFLGQYLDVVSSLPPEPVLFVDFEVENLVVTPKKLFEFETVTFSFSLKNIGSEDATQPFKVKLFPGEVSKGLTQPILLDINELKAGESIEITHTAELPPGDYEVVIDIDPFRFSVYTEPDRNNNVLIQPIHVYSEKEAFLVSNENWQDVLKLVSLTIWTDASASIHKYPTLIYHKEESPVAPPESNLTETHFDADSSIYFLQQYKPTHLSIFGDTPIDLDGLLIAPDEQLVGAGLDQSQISKYSIDDYLSFWASIDKVVISENDYETGLMASVLASYLNAPLLFDGEVDYQLLDDSAVYIIGDVKQELNEAEQTRRGTGVKRYNLEQLRTAYASWTGTNKIILVNPDDLQIVFNKEFDPEKSETIVDLYTKHSLAAPFLASAKYEVIISTKANTYLAVDDYVEDAIESLNLPGALIYLTIVANPLAIPIARENRNSDPAFWDNKLVYEQIDPSLINSYPTSPIGLKLVTLETSSGTPTTSGRIITNTQSKEPRNPAIYEDNIVWSDYRNGNWDIYMYDLTSNVETQITTDSNEQNYPAISGDKIVWMDKRNVNWDLYMYDLTSNVETQITTDSNEQKFPAISGDKIVWMDNRTGNWDIYMYDLTSNVETQITTDPNAQQYPEISEDKIVWMDNRNIQWDWGGKRHWDIYMLDLSERLRQEIRITQNEFDQVYPKISGNWIVWEDSRNGEYNHDIFLYDIEQEKETWLTSSTNQQIRPIVQGDTVVWYSEGHTSTPGRNVATPAGPTGGKWLTYFYEIPTKTIKICSPELLSHEDAVYRQETDGRYYGSILNYGLQDRAVGRIYGVSSSDVSAYIARVLFFDDLTKSKDALLIILEDHQIEIKDCLNGTMLEQYARDNYWTSDVSKLFDTVHFYAGFDIGSTTATPVNQNLDIIRELYNSSYLIIYTDHGSGSGFDNVVTNPLLENKWLQPSIVLDIACATGTASYGYIPGPDNCFAMMNIRRGAIVFMGAVDLSYWHRMFDNILEEVFINGKTIGEAYLEARNEDFLYNVNNFCRHRRGDPFYALLGDPTFVPYWWGGYIL